MKTMKKTAAGIALLATAGLVAGPMAGMSQAWAADMTITMETPEGSTNAASYTAYEVFAADIKDGKASNIKWANGISDAGKAAIAEALGVTDTVNQAQACAEALNDLSDNPADGGIIDSKAKLMEIAKLVQTHGTAVEFADKVATVSETGYYMIIGSATGESVATAPIFTLVDKNLTVTEKVSVPTVSKQVKDDAEGADFDEAADAEFAQNLEFKLEGSLPSNLASFDKYVYKFHDTFAEGLFTVSDVAVTAGGIDITAQITGEAGSITTTNTGVEISIADLKSMNLGEGKTLAATDKVVVTYKAKLNKGVAKTDAANENQVTLEYSNNPMATGTGTSKPDDAKVYSYALKLNKIDSVTNQTIQTEATDSAATFTLQECDATGKAIEGAQVFEVSTVNGVATAEGLDRGTYLVTEAVAPKGYSKVEPFVVTIGGGMGEAITTTVPSDLLVSTDSADTLTVKDTPNPLNLPITGQSGIMLSVVGGMVLVGIAAGGIAINRRNRRKSIED